MYDGDEEQLIRPIEDDSSPDLIRALLVILIAAICATVLITAFVDADAELDSIEFGVNVTVSEPPGDCPHAMLIAPIDNSVVDTRDVVLTLYVYDNDVSVWFINVTFYENNTDTVISNLVSKSDTNVSCVWTNRTPGTNYEWYGYLENSSGGNYTTGVYSFSVSQSFMGTATDFWGTWILLGIIFLIMALGLYLRSTIFCIFSIIITVLSTTYYYSEVMASSSFFDTTLGYVFMALIFFTLAELFYVMFYGKK